MVFFSSCAIATEHDVHIFGTVGHVCATKCESVKISGKSICTTLNEFENVRAVSNRTECKDMVVPHDDHMLYFASLGAAALSYAHRSQRGLHGVVAAFTLCILFRYHSRLLVLSSLFKCHFEVTTTRPLAPLQH